MKRTGRLPRSTPLAPGERRGHNSTLRPVNPKTGGSRFPKQRQPAYTAWIKALPCTVAGRECWGPIDPAHVNRTRAQGVPDLGEVVPLCRRHHEEQEGRTARFNAKYRIDLTAIAADLAARRPWPGSPGDGA